MNLNITGKNIQVTEGLRSYVDKKIEHVKYFFPHLIDVHVVMEVEKIIHKVEITIKADGKTFHSEYKTEDMYEAIDGLIDRVERQVRRYKEKLHEFKSKNVAQALKESEVHEDSDIIFTKVREIQPKPMSDEEAILQLSDSEFSFHIYKKSPEMTEEDYAKLVEQDVNFQKSILIKEGDQYIAFRRTNGHWDEETFRVEGEAITLLGSKKEVVIVEEKNIEDAVTHMFEGEKRYHIFYDESHKHLSIVYLRRNNTLGLITSSNTQN